MAYRYSASKCMILKYLFQLFIFLTGEHTVRCVFIHFMRGSEYSVCETLRVRSLGFCTYFLKINIQYYWNMKEAIVLYEF